MKTIRAVTLDFYGTLATHGTCEDVYAQFTRKRLPVASFRHRFDQEMIAFFGWLTDRELHHVPEFPTIRWIYRNVFRKLFDEFGIHADVEAATGALMDHVARPELFPETLEALATLGTRFDLCLVTDADDDMIATALSHTGIAVGHIVTSHSMRAYKTTKDSPLFSQALRLLGTTAEETVHIGDRITDVLAAKWNGLRVVCVQRDGKAWTHPSIQPDAIVKDLTEAIEWIMRASP